VCAVNGSVLHRRRIERYARLLDEASGARRHHSRTSIDDELATMLMVGQRLADATPEVHPTEEFRRDTRAMLLAVAERDGIGRTARTDAPEIQLTAPAVGRATVGTIHQSASRAPKQRGPKTRLTANHGRTRGAILVGLAVGTLALSGISAASGEAMPGDTLYGMKRSAENAQIALAGSNQSKGELYLEFASTRLNEAEAVQPTLKSVSNVLRDMDSQEKTGAKLLFTDALKNKDASALTTVNTFVAGQSRRLSDWTDGLADPGLRSRALDSQTVLDMIRTRSAEIAQALSCPSTVRITGTDAFGPEPSCQSGALAAPPTPNTHRGAGSPAGTPTALSSGSTKGKTTEHTVTPSTGPGGTTPSASPTVPPPGSGGGTPTASPTPENSPTYNGGLLGTVGKILGGL
jgi:hypothetical protein